MVPQDHRFRRRAARRARQPRELARQGPADAGKLDRQVQGARIRFQSVEWRHAAGLYHQARHDLRGELRRSCRRPSGRASGRQRRGPRLHRRMQEGRHHGGRTRNRREAGFRYRDHRQAPVHRRRPARLYRELRADGLRHRRDHGGTGPRPARFRIRHQIRTADPPGRRAQRRSGEQALRRRGRGGRGRAGQFGLSRRDGSRGRQARNHRAHRGTGTRQRQDRVAAARLGCVAPAVLGHADPLHPLREMRRGPRAQGQPADHAARGCRFPDPRQSAVAPSHLETCRLPHMRREGGTRDRHARHFRRQFVVFPALRQPAGGQAVRQGRDRQMAAGRTVYRRDRTRDPAPALRPVLDPRTGAYGPDRRDRTLRLAVHAGHGHA